MATSRSGTARHKRFAKAVLRAGQGEGVTHCPVPDCGVELDYDVSRKPNSAEPDHIIPPKFGGTDDPENGRVICRQCNQKRGDGSREVRRGEPAVVISSHIW